MENKDKARVLDQTRMSEDAKRQLLRDFLQRELQRRMLGAENSRDPYKILPEEWRDLVRKNRDFAKTVFNEDEKSNSRWTAGDMEYLAELLNVMMNSGKTRSRTGGVVGRGSSGESDLAWNQAHDYLWDLKTGEGL